MPTNLTDRELASLSPAADDLSSFNLQLLPPETWLLVLQQSCDFGTDVFKSVSLNLLKNPNINSSLLFRADILYDSSDELTDDALVEAERRRVLRTYSIQHGDLPGYTVERTILRRMIPRNPQLDKPILQTCVFLRCSNSSIQQSLVVYIPHAPSAEEMPWYHPRVQALAYLHTCPTTGKPEVTGTVQLYYRLFPDEARPLSTRLERTAQHLLSTIIKHGHGSVSGYEKRVRHDQLISQQRVQGTYTELKRKHAKRLCDNWIEKTEPSKHVFEDLGIAAFLIELWRDMYDIDISSDETERKLNLQNKLPFPGFVDIGCGNGVLVDILIREGYQGWGFDARKRKTWTTFDASIREHLKDLILIPSPLFPDIHKRESMWSLTSLKHSLYASLPSNTHNGIFPQGTFIISNHADELTPWTPLLASLSESPFLCIPCCSHNLSGARFRAPSVFNNNTADAFAPSYFANCISNSKAVRLTIANTDNEEMYSPDPPDANPRTEPEKGDLKAMKVQRNKQPSAYTSLCDWVGHLAARVGYEVEKEMLRMPSTRNVGLVGRTWREGFIGEELAVRRERIDDIVREEKADKTVWMQRAELLKKGKADAH